jgi:hypothetical protein
MKKDKKYKEKYKQLKHQVQEEQRHAYNTYIGDFEDLLVFCR